MDSTGESSMCVRGGTCGMDLTGENSMCVRGGTCGMELDRRELDRDSSFRLPRSR